MRWIVLALLASACASTPPRSTPSNGSVLAAAAEPASQAPAAPAPEHTAPAEETWLVFTDGRPRIVTTSSSLWTLAPIQFRGATTTLEPTSTEALDALVSTLQGNPSLKRIEVHAFGDEADPPARLQLAEARARVLVEHLVGKGIARERLTPIGEATSSTKTSEPTFVIAERD